MHPRNIYNTPPDFAELAEAVPALKPFIKSSKYGSGGPTIDFKDPEALRTLTKALLERDFNRHVYLAEDRLCPPVAGRLDYVLYVQDVVRHHRQVKAQYGGNANTETDIVGLDIGTGASAIYPLLFTAVEDHVRMLGTDINGRSLDIARENVQRNHLSRNLTILQVSPEDGFFNEALKRTAHLDFTMCNPPFYVSDEEMERLTSEKELPPNATCTGAPNEMITQGGEIAFVKRMIRQSQTYGNRIDWYTSLLGKATSVISLVKELADIGCSNYGLIESSPSQTHRWILLWSWSNIRLPDELARCLPFSSALTKSLPPPNELTYYCHATITLPTATTLLGDFLSSLDLQVFSAFNEHEARRTYMVQANYASWTRAARRMRARAETEQDPQRQNLLMACELSLAPMAVDNGTLEQIQFKAVWKQGLDRQSFESFFSTCVRKLASPATRLNATDPTSTG